MAKSKILICPYCGETQPQAESCRACNGFFEPLSRQATHNAMGPWFMREADQPFQPGCSYETLLSLIERGKVDKYTIVRGPTTKQFWTIAKRVPGLAHVLGYCHNCDASVDPADHGCHLCGVPFGAYLDRNYLGLPDIRSLPWEAQIDADEASQFVDPASHWGRTPSSSAGISSFASDEELRGNIAPEPGSGHTRGSRVSPSIEGETAVASTHAKTSRLAEPSGDASSVFDEYAASAQARSLQRKLINQKRTIRMLALSVVVVAGGSAAFVLITMGNNADKSEEVVTSADANEDPANPKAVIKENTSPVVDEQITEPAPLEEIQLPENTLHLEVQENFDRALKLIESASQQERSPEDRVKDYKAAIEILLYIDATAKQAARPEGLKKLLQDTEKELERLELQDFFSPEIDDGN